ERDNGGPLQALAKVAFKRCDCLLISFWAWAVEIKMKVAMRKDTQAVDPVCGMTVDPMRAAAVSERDGKTYYFCSQSCKERFDAATPEETRSVETGDAHGEAA